MSSHRGLRNMTLVPPGSTLAQMVHGFWVTQAIYVAAKLGIADLVEDGPRTCDELAMAADANPEALYRLLRALASLGIFREVEDRRFGLTPLAEPLQTGTLDSVRNTALMPVDTGFRQQWGEILYSVRTGKPAFDYVFGMGNHRYFAKHPESSQVFSGAMTEVGREDSAAVLEAYDFSGITKLVDLGGGRGTFLADILKAYPRMHGLLFDMPHVVEGAREVMEADGVADRCELVSGDFFQSVPAGGDAYIIKNVIHDWYDPEAAVILKNCRSGIAAGGRLLIVDFVIPLGNEPHPGKLMDLAMLVGAGGRERTGPEFHSLLDAASFQLTRIIPTRSAYNVVEATTA